MILGSLKENNVGEDRIAISPETCKKLTKLGCSVLIEKNAGVNSSFSNEEYEKAGTLMMNILMAKLICSKMIQIINPISITTGTHH